MITLPICRQQYSSFNDDKRGIFHTLINTSFASRSSCAFFVQGGLSPPEFCCAFFKAQKVPPWNKNSAPLTKKSSPLIEKKPPPEKADPPINFPLLTKSVTWDTVCGPTGTLSVCQYPFCLRSKVWDRIQRLQANSKVLKGSNSKSCYLYQIFRHIL